MTASPVIRFPWPSPKDCQRSSAVASNFSYAQQQLVNLGGDYAYLLSLIVALQADVATLQGQVSALQTAVTALQAEILAGGVIAWTIVIPPAPAFPYYTVSSQYPQTVDATNASIVIPSSGDLAVNPGDNLRLTATFNVQGISSGQGMCGWAYDLSPITAVTAANSFGYVSNQITEQAQEWDWTAPDPVPAEIYFLWGLGALSGNQINMFVGDGSAAGPSSDYLCKPLVLKLCRATEPTTNTP